MSPGVCLGFFTKPGTRDYFFVGMYACNVCLEWVFGVSVWSECLE